jgi:phosphate transport system substrate-binding protein
VRDAGVARLTATQVERIYRGEIERWGEIPAYTGPDKEIQVVGRSAGSGSAAAFRANLLGSSDTELDGVDVRKDQSQQVETLVANADNAVAYLALAFVHPDGQVPPVALEVDGTTYEYGRNFDAPDYPLARDLHVYTYGGTSEKEAAFVRMLLSDYGQRTFVASNGYLPLPPARRRAQRRDLPGTVRDSSESPAETESETETTSS